jgi:hypothetical protein
LCALSKLLKKNHINKTIKKLEIKESPSEDKTEKIPQREKIYSLYRKRNEKVNKMNNEININKTAKNDNLMNDNIEKSENYFTNKTFERYFKRNSTQKNKKLKNELFLGYIKEIDTKNKEFEKHNITTKIVKKSLEEIKSKEKYKLILN